MRESTDSFGENGTGTSGDSPGDSPGDSAGDGGWLGEPVERFRPTTGALVGWVGIALAVLLIGYLATTERSVVGLRVGLGVAFAAVLVWATQLRPRATAYPRHLRLHGSVRDVYLPYAVVNQVSMGQTLNVWAGRRRFVCVGIGRPIGYEMRQRVRSHGHGGLLGGNRSYQFVGRAETTQVRNVGGSYDAFVLDRINDLVSAARKAAERDGAEPVDLAVRRRLAVPETVALAVTGIGFLVSLLLR